MRILRNLAKIPKRNRGIDLHELVYFEQIYQEYRKLFVNIIYLFIYSIMDDFLTQNNFHLKSWHIENMEKTVIKYVKGLPQDASKWEIRKHKKYGKLSNIIRNIHYDIKHGVTNDQVIEVFVKIRNEPLFCDLQNNLDAMNRLGDLERHWKEI